VYVGARGGEGGIRIGMGGVFTGEDGNVAVGAVDVFF